MVQSRKALCFQNKLSASVRPFSAVTKCYLLFSVATTWPLLGTCVSGQRMPTSVGKSVQGVGGDQEGGRTRQVWEEWGKDGAGRIADQGKEGVDIGCSNTTDISALILQHRFTQTCKLLTQVLIDPAGCYLLNTGQDRKCSLILRRPLEPETDP